MTAAATPLGNDVRVIGWVSVAHALSHFFQLVFPPLFPLVKDTFDVSYAQLGLVLTVYYVFSGVLQTVAGFAVDRFGPRAMLLAGLVCAASGALIAGLATGLPMLVLAAVIGGIGNSVFHPADLALINAKVDTRRLGYAFSIHQVGGSIGYVIAPLFAVSVAQFFGWRAALVAAALIGLAFTAVCALQGSIRLERAIAPRREAGERQSDGWRVLATLPVISGFAFFMMLAIAFVGFMTFSPTAFVELYGVPMVTGASFLTALLIGVIVGTLAGGVVVTRSERHDRYALAAVLIAAIVALCVGIFALPIALLWPGFFVVGFGLGLANPSRDVLVREMAPPIHRGKVYGFVYSGLDAGAGIAPPVFGWFLDRGLPGATFAAGALCLALALPAVFGMRRGVRPKVDPAR